MPPEAVGPRLMVAPDGFLVSGQNLKHDLTWKELMDGEDAHLLTTEIMLTGGTMWALLALVAASKDLRSSTSCLEVFFCMCCCCCCVDMLLFAPRRRFLRLVESLPLRYRSGHLIWFSGGFQHFSFLNLLPLFIAKYLISRRACPTFS